MARSFNLACYSNICYNLGLPVVSRVNSAIKAWNKLEVTYANKSHTHMLGLLDALTKVNKEGKIVADYMQGKNYHWWPFNNWSSLKWWRNYHSLTQWSLFEIKRTYNHHSCSRLIDVIWRITWQTSWSWIILEMRRIQEGYSTNYCSI